MEPFAAKTVLLHLANDHGLQTSSITTDRSSNVKAVIAELKSELPQGFPWVKHYFDIWHYNKNIMKDLWDAAKLKSCSGLILWLPSINNMLWWSFATSIGNKVMLEEKILSITKHITNQHTFLDNIEHKACGHAVLPDDNKGKPWLHPESLAVKKVDRAIAGKDNCRIKELEHMLGFTHTGLIESWNALNTKYASKDVYYSPIGMFVRAALTSIDWNSNDIQNHCY